MSSRTDPASVARRRRRRRGFGAGAALAASCLLAAACGAASTAATPSAAGPAGFSSCRLDGGLAALCGTVQVPADPSDPDGETLDLGVAVLRGTAAAADAVPVYMLAGGPGQSAITAYPPVLAQLPELRRRHDVVLVDQRGTGRSSKMVCDEIDDPARRLDPTPDFEALERCRETLPLDPRLVTTEHAVSDLDRVRAALGHERVALVGVSYGTRLALAYLRRHGDRVAVAVLDGVAPPPMVLFEDFAPDAQAALDGRLARCRADAACAAAFGDLGSRVSEALSELAGDPRPLVVQHPRTNEPVTLAWSRRLAASALRGLLYSTDLAPVLPFTLDRLAADDPGPLVAQALVFSDEVEASMAAGMMLSVVCAEDVPFFDPARARAKAEGTFLGTILVEAMAEVCQRWPHAVVSADVKAPVHSEVPVLLLSGELDPVTPPRWAELARKTLPNAIHHVSPGAGHGTLLAACVPDLLVAFLRDPAATDAALAACADPPYEAPFFVDAGGPPP